MRSFILNHSCCTQDYCHPFSEHTQSNDFSCANKQSHCLQPQLFLARAPRIYTSGKFSICSINSWPHAVHMRCLDLFLPLICIFALPDLLPPMSFFLLSLGTSFLFSVSIPNPFEGPAISEITQCSVSGLFQVNYILHVVTNTSFLFSKG